jgi:hypothetical protein
MRIELVFGGEPGPEDAALVEDGHAMPETGYAVRFALAAFGHAPGCACCTLRGPAADALGRMFRARATGAAPFFRRVMVCASEAGVAAVREAVATDVVTMARFRAESASFSKQPFAGGGRKKPLS